MEPQNSAVETTEGFKESHVFFKLNKQVYGIRTEFVLEMVILKNVTPVPQAPDFIRGVINLRGTVLPVMDLRARFHMPGVFDEVNGVVDILKQRKQDHINWLQELRASVEEEREFNLQVDPHKCAFGKWYDSYQADNSLLRMQLNKFDTPHKKIHGLAADVQKLVASGQKAKALAFIDNAWDTELAQMVRLFDETDHVVRSNTKEIVLVTKGRDGLMGLLVDSVLDLQNISQESVEKEWTTKKQAASAEFIYGLARVGEEVRILIEYDRLWQDQQ